MNVLTSLLKLCWSTLLPWTEVKSHVSSSSVCHLLNFVLVINQLYSLVWRRTWGFPPLRLSSSAANALGIGPNSTCSKPARKWRGSLTRSALWLHPTESANMFGSLPKPSLYASRTLSWHPDSSGLSPLHTSSVGRLKLPASMCRMHPMFDVCRIKPSVCQDLSFCLVMFSILCSVLSVYVDISFILALMFPSYVFVCRSRSAHPPKSCLHLSVISRSARVPAGSDFTSRLLPSCFSLICIIINSLVLCRS